MKRKESPSMIGPIIQISIGVPLAFGVWLLIDWLSWEVLKYVGAVP